MEIVCGLRSLDLSSPQVMGVLNVTPDSFSDGGLIDGAGELNLSKALRHAEQMVNEGAAIIDVGGESTRPGANSVTLAVEMARVLPVIEAIASRFDVIISVDTSSPELMRSAAAAGAGMLNDVRALERPGAIAVAVESGLAVCLMHRQGEPGSMQDRPRYDDVVAEVAAYLAARVEQVVAGGVPSERIVLDPGFGFGKSLQHNLQLLNRLSSLQALGYPVLVGLSRKAMIGKLTGREVGQRLAGSLALAVLSVQSGASIVRAHDVEATVDALRICQAVFTETD